MVLYIKIVNELQSLGMMGELIARYFSWVGSSNSMYTICTHENRPYYIFKINNLTTDQRTENPRVGSSILSRPTFLTLLKLVTYIVFVSIFFYFSSAEFSCNKSKRTSCFELIYRYFERSICTQRVHTAFGFYRFQVNTRT